MENDFRNLTASVWAKLDNQIKKLCFLYAALSGGTLLQSVMSQQYDCLMELYTNFTKSYFSWKYSFALLLYLGMLGLLIVHAFMIELDQPDYWYPRKF